MKRFNVRGVSPTNFWIPNRKFDQAEPGGAICTPIDLLQ